MKRAYRLVTFDQWQHKPHIRVKVKRYINHKLRRTRIYELPTRTSLKRLMDVLGTCPSYIDVDEYNIDIFYDEFWESVDEM